MEYLSLLVVLLCAVVAIRGETWKPSARGLRRVTGTGWTTLGLALIGFALAASINYQSKAAAERSSAQLQSARDDAARAANEILDLKAKLGIYQTVVQQIKDYAERQQQTVMVQSIHLPPGGRWNAPNKLYPGSRIEIYFMSGRSVDLTYGGRAQELRRGPDDWARAFVAGESGTELGWYLDNTSDGYLDAKVAIYSSPRTRSREWSWLEERLEKVPSESGS